MCVFRLWTAGRPEKSVSKSYALLRRISFQFVRVLPGDVRLIIRVIVQSSHVFVPEAHVPSAIWRRRGAAAIMFVPARRNIIHVANCTLHNVYILQILYKHIFVYLHIYILRSDTPIMTYTPQSRQNATIGCRPRVVHSILRSFLREIRTQYVYFSVRSDRICEYISRDIVMLFICVDDRAGSRKSS